MTKSENALVVMCAGMFGILALAFAFNYVDVGAMSATYPPTNAFSKIITGGKTQEAEIYNDVLYLDYPYAQLSDLTTQATEDNGVASNITFNKNDNLHKIAHSNSTNSHEITITESGTYLIIAVPQIGEATPQASGTHNFWLMKNGNQISNTNIKTTVMLQLTGSETMTGTLNWIGSLHAGDIIYFQQSSTDPDIGIIFSDSGVPPATPSIIASIVRIS